MKKSLLLSILFVSSITFSQEKKIEVVAEKGKGFISFYCINNTNVTQEVNFGLKKAKGVLGNKKAIVKKVPANKKVQLIKYKTKSGKYSYSTYYTYKASPNAKEKAVIAQKLKKRVLKNIDNINKGIVIFNKTGCTRCSYTTNYLTENNIDFKVLNVNMGKDNNALMWQILRENGVNSKNILTPIVLINGKLVNSQGDIKEFAKTLK